MDFGWMAERICNLLVAGSCQILKSQSVISSFVALGKWGGRRTLPYVFSEQGVAKKLDELDRRVSKHDDAITSIVRAIRELATPSESKPKRRIGFVSEE